MAAPTATRRAGSPDFPREPRLGAGGGVEVDQLLLSLAKNARATGVVVAVAGGIHGYHVVRPTSNCVRTKARGILVRRRTTGDIRP
jgi:hypothetical protein